MVESTFCDNLTKIFQFQGPPGPQGIQGEIGLPGNILLKYFVLGKLPISKQNDK